MIGEEILLLSPCSEESSGQLSEGTIGPLLFDDLLLFPPDFQPLQVVETHENPVRVKDLGNHTSLPGTWMLNKYNTVELTVKRTFVPIIVAEESWCKGNSKAPQTQVAEPFYTLSVCIMSNDLKTLWKVLVSINERRNCSNLHSFKTS